MLTGAGTLPRRYRGTPVPKWFDEGTSQALESLELRSSDIVLCSWPKSGTHWLYKALRLLSNDTVDDKDSMALAEMLPPQKPETPAVTPWNPTGEDSFEALLARQTDPRIIVTHAPASWLPFTRKDSLGKVVYISRDPRDTLVSNYFFMGTPADGWDGSMNRFLASAAETPNAFGDWFEHVLGFEELIRRLGPQRACYVEYELMQQDMLGQLQRLAELLGEDAQMRLEKNKDAICEALAFDTMKKQSADAKFLRKGVVGDWATHFSEQDTMRFHEAIRARLPDSCNVGKETWRKSAATSHVQEN
eukprot:TRINITY_DN22642_c0_g1_i1.p1 TRINITY_DN22642_c0_g1~~TRINITY_DN22642_c0_g1_i1.p1  ORF type:complete len:304 (+),score=62.25 TRINITY_DN22642_c0_g1_i1:72-983(+)